MNGSRYLKPMSLSEILDSSVNVYRQNLLQLVKARLPLTISGFVSTVAAMWAMNSGDISLPAALGQLQLFPPLYFLDSYRGLLSQGILLSIVFIQMAVVYPLALSAVVKVATEGLLKHSSSLREIYCFRIHELHKIGLTNIIMTAIFMVVYFTPFAVSVLILKPYLGISAENMGIVVGLILMGMLWARLAVTYPVMVNEHKFSFEALNRSRAIVKGYESRTFFALFVVFLFSFCILLFPIIVEAAYGRDPTVLSLVTSIAAQGLLLPLVDTTRVVIYFELRARKEGIDLVKRTEDLIDV